MYIGTQRDGNACKGMDYVNIGFSSSALTFRQRQRDKCSMVGGDEQLNLAYTLKLTRLEICAY
jgi:hypothetical protein